MPRHICQSCETIHYKNPLIVVGCLVVHQNKVMLCRRGIEPQLGLWNLPAGFMENKETVAEGAAREVLEETEAEVGNLSLFSVYSVPHVNQVHMHFKANLLKEHWANTPESTEIKFFTFEEIPWEEIAFSSNVFSLKALTGKAEAASEHLEIVIGSHTY
jgi:ADP-ribose pyrophosphatase YjhB (NUDIX family)